jgi:hypothetical protein
MPDELSGGPHLMAAFLCDRVLQEKDGVLSFIRVVDRFVRPRPTAQIPPQPVQVTLVIAFKGGGIGPGNFKIKLRLFKPNTSSPLVQMENEAFFEGGQEVGVNVVAPFLILADEEGLYWIDVLFEDRLVTRIPFRVIFAAVPTVQQQPPAGA